MSAAKARVANSMKCASSNSKDALTRTGTWRGASWRFDLAHVAVDHQALELQESLGVCAGTEKTWLNRPPWPQHASGERAPTRGWRPPRAVSAQQFHAQFPGRLGVEGEHAGLVLRSQHSDARVSWVVAVSSRRPVAAAEVTAPPGRRPRASGSSGSRLATRSPSHSASSARLRR